MGKKILNNFEVKSGFFLSTYSKEKVNARTMNQLVQILNLPHKNPMIIKLSPKRTMLVTLSNIKEENFSLESFDSIELYL